MRYVVIVALSLVLAGAASAAGPSPLALGGMLESHGIVDLGSAPKGGEFLRFLPRAQFQLGLLVRNTSHEKLEITSARVLTPSRTLIHQVGTGFHPWHVFKCPASANCPGHAFPLKGGHAHPRPFGLAGGKSVGVELDFQLGSCAEIPHAVSAAVSRLRVTYRRPNGTTGHRVFSLGGATLHLRTPKPADCQDPRSYLAVDGPQQYESGSTWTIPGSTGDVCTIRNGRLYFQSRKFQTHVSRAFNRSHYERVTLQMHFRGTGTYSSHATVKLVAGGKSVFRSRNPVVQVTEATKREVVAKIETGRPPSGTIHGSPFRISGTMRCSVR